MTKKKRKDRTYRFELVGAESEVEDFLIGFGLDYYKGKADEKTVFEFQDGGDRVSAAAMYIYSQFDYESFSAIDDKGHVFICG